MDQQEIYANHAEAYDELVTAEDVDGNLAAALQRVMPDVGRVVEVGAGTGRVTRLLARMGATVLATEPAAAMLDVARRHLGAHENVRLALASAGSLPADDDWADAVVAGWVFGHFRYWMPEGWQDEIAGFLAECERVVRPGGAVVVIETLGTGSAKPAAPSPELDEYYRWLEGRGFTRTWFRTDYQFDSVDEAARVTGFFFGEEFGERVRREGWARIPECTGLWSRRT